MFVLVGRQNNVLPWLLDPEWVLPAERKLILFFKLTVRSSAGMDAEGRSWKNQR